MRNGIGLSRVRHGAQRFAVEEARILVAVDVVVRVIENEIGLDAAERFYDPGF
jgi:hypothetical protein